jgi:hypothetical protein
MKSLGGALLQRLSHLAGQIQETDFHPTDHKWPFTGCSRGRSPGCARFDGLSSDDISRFNELLKQSGRPALALVAKD